MTAEAGTIPAPDAQRWDRLADAGLIGRTRLALEERNFSVQVVADRGQALAACST
jgi:hypothetical protein